MKNKHSNIGIWSFIPIIVGTPLALIVSLFSENSTNEDWFSFIILFLWFFGVVGYAFAVYFKMRLDDIEMKFDERLDDIKIKLNEYEEHIRRLTK